jgi:hypothetical protein
MAEKKKKKFVIDEDIVKEVSNTLQAFIEHIDSDCAASGCMCDLRGEVCSQYISNTLHDFESGLCLLKASFTKGVPKEKMKIEVETGPDYIMNAPVVFGLQRQGHIPTIEKMLKEGATWEEIGKEIGWCAETAKEHYIWFILKKKEEEK